MNYRFFKYLLVFFAVIAAKSRCESKKHQNHLVYQHFFNTTLHSGQNNAHLPSNYFLGTYGSVQIYRSQTQRGVSLFKPPFTYTTKFNAYFQFLSNIFQHTRAGYVRWCKLILFPFHVFW